MKLKDELKNMLDKASEAKKPKPSNINLEKKSS
jgi:hypothetical protein